MPIDAFLVQAVTTESGGPGRHAYISHLLGAVAERMLRLSARWIDAGNTWPRHYVRRTHSGVPSMSVPPRLTSKLHEVLGSGAAEDIVNWLDEERAHREEIIESVRADFAELRQEMHAGFAELRQEMQVGFAQLREHLVIQLRGVDGQLHGLENQIHDVETQLRASETRQAERHVELLRWSFVFWVGAVLSIAVLAKVLH
jgi:hypothetical protein